MTFLLDIIRNCLRDPRGAARWLMEVDVHPQVWWILMVLPQIIMAPLIGPIPVPTPEGEGLVVLTPQPLVLAVITAALRLALLFGTLYVGRWIGGTGTLDRLLRAISAQNLVVFAISIVAMPVSLLLPGLGALLALAAWVYGIWVAVCLMQEAHRFSAATPALFTYVGFYVLLFFFGALLLSPVLGPIAADIPGGSL